MVILTWKSMKIISQAYKNSGVIMTETQNVYRNHISFYYLMNSLRSCGIFKAMKDKNNARRYIYRLTGVGEELAKRINGLLDIVSKLERRGLDAEEKKI
jgi:DNA-binding PadR family transcriptional regulator